MSRFCKTENMTVLLLKIFFRLYFALSLLRIYEADLAGGQLKFPLKSAIFIYVDKFTLSFD